jgi:hypothetical protein
MNPLAPEDLPVATTPEEWAKIAGKNCSEEGLHPRTRCHRPCRSSADGDEADWERAAKRVGASLESRVAWLLKLAHWKVARDTDDPELKRELAIFMGDREIVFPSLKGLLRQISLLRSILSNGGEWQGYIKTSYKFSMSKEGELKIRPAINNKAYPQLISELCKTLMDAKGILKLCARPGCQKLFMRHKRQEYCSKKCGVKVRLKKHREVKKVNLAIQQYTNAQYLDLH